ncbi:MAG TPA: regulatory iron-sulfur-containing complex subunit RicT [Saprospiraceae bacterium]|nr:regulatory iron-sulfur-containing complex subunit RicT [Saprospiraceae bacterium]
MGCVGCSCSTGKDTASGCKSNGGCATGGCNRHNTYDWITAQGINDARPFDIVEVSFKNGSRKEFFKNPPFTRATTGDWVIVESMSGGFDVGKVSLSGELVRLQMKRKRVRPDARLSTVVRKAHERDLERLDEVRGDEKSILIQARAIARTLDLDMKIGDVEFQGDGRKCTFYYTADGRVDFRELIRHYARDFKVKIEMRQIGARQESARIGGLGNCGRELCCSTWLTEFKSVNTAAARYQNLAINQTKLSGMCGRLKCCLNYELDTYIDALEDFPDRAERLKTGAGLAILIKTDVFKRLMYYTYADDRSKFIAVHVDQIWEALDMLKSGKVPGSLEDILAMAPQVESDEPDEAEPDFENVHDVIQLPLEKRKKKKKKNKSNRDRSQTAAAAVEKAAQQDDLSQKQPPRRDDRNRRPDNRQQQRPPQQQQQQQRPPQSQQPRKDAPPPQARKDAPPQAPRPPQAPPPENRQTPPPQPRKEGDQQQRPPADDKNAGKGNFKGNNRRRDKRPPFKGV